MTTAAPSHLLVIRETTPEAYEALTPSQKRRALDEWNAWVDMMAARGVVRDGNTLGDEGRLVSGAGGSVTDGPFAEAKELVGGYFLLAETSLEEVTGLARECPLLRFGMTIEIRPIARACHLARSLGMTTMREPEEA